LAREFDGLPLGLEQAAAYIATERISFARYLRVLNAGRARALGWSIESLTGSDSTVATIWENSVARLTPESRRLLDRLAMLTPAPIPDVLMDVAVPGEATDYDAYKARAGLFTYSLIARAKSESGAPPGFVIHRLVQDFARSAMSKERHAEALRETLDWVRRALESPFLAKEARTMLRRHLSRSHLIALAHIRDHPDLPEKTSEME
jgi:hypothetical protein